MDILRNVLLLKIVTPIPFFCIIASISVSTEASEMGDI
jgi:hypothetical protein